MQFTTANQADLRDFSAGPTLLDAAKAPFRLGWAFLLAWVFCVFYLQLFGVPSGDALIVAKMMPAPLELFFNAFPVFVSVATLAAVIAAERRVGPPSAHPRFELATAVVAALGTPLLLVSADSIAATTVIFAAASLLTGIGSGVMWVSWGEHYARIPQEEVELFGPVSAVLGALITLGVSAMSGWITVAVVASFPLLSGLWETKPLHSRRSPFPPPWGAPSWASWQHACSYALPALLWKEGAPTTAQACRGHCSYPPCSRLPSHSYLSWGRAAFPFRSSTAGCARHSCWDSRRLFCSEMRWAATSRSPCRWPHASRFA